ncbi:hypothetical protein OHA72_62860 [Dactylosporangium sp. NBC_01737]|uniref:hypothetical protein n=1 Tax=Dactylosporangium sp. NBC_01737 TaxID=2975959 RepID=UPI002E127159|nr:hypothetical protein OHA72_62860 [Dactylosporangium sp. NBC_01737]
MTVTDVGPSAARALGAVAAAFARHGVDHPLADAHRAGAGWLSGCHADPLIVRGAARYSTGLERGIEDLVRVAAPAATLTLDWDPFARALDTYAWTGPAVYRLAELFAVLDGGALLARAGRGLLDPGRDAAASWTALVQARAICCTTRSARHPRSPAWIGARRGRRPPTRSAACASCRPATGRSRGRCPASPACGPAGQRWTTPR